MKRYNPQKSPRRSFEKSRDQHFTNHLHFIQKSFNQNGTDCISITKHIQESNKMNDCNIFHFELFYSTHGSHLMESNES